MSLRYFWLLLSLPLSLFSSIWYAQNPSGHSLAASAIWLFSLFCVLLHVVIETGSEKKIPHAHTALKQILTKHFLFLIIIVIAALLRFVRLTSIPIFTHDEVKDAGLYPKLVLSGIHKDYFGFNAGINQVFFLLASVPHLLFTDPILKVRFFSALFGVATVALIYVAGNYLFSKKTGIIAGFLLSAYHVHLFFSRTELLNLFDSFYSILLLLLYFMYSKSRTHTSLIILAIMLGFGLHFYSGLRAIIAIITAFTLFSFFSVKGLRAKGWSFASLILFFLVGLGPTIALLFTGRLTEIMASGNANLIFQSNSSIAQNAQHLLINYGASLLAFVKIPIGFHYYYGGPFILLPFSLYFIFGVILLLLKPRKGINLLILTCLFGIPFFNSAILSSINNAHRLMSLVPLIILITAQGIASTAVFIGKKINVRVAVGFTIVVIALFIYQNLTLFFVKNVWENALNINEFSAWEIQKIVRKENPHITKVLFIGSPIYPSSKSVPPLDYLTKEYDFVDIKSQEDLITTAKNSERSNLLYIILPDNSAGVTASIIGNNVKSSEAYSKQDVYYKNMYLFSTIQVKNYKNLLKNPRTP